jgi:ABC-2 type transport system ATP-binding protein
MSSVPALNVHHVSHRYGDRDALVDLSFEIAPGEMFALLGPNGSGKSTLFRLISTIMPLQEGQILVGGFNLRADPNAVRKRIGVLFQNPALDKQLTVAENIRCHGHLYGLSGRRLRHRIGALLERFGLLDREHDRVAALSGGMRRKVELAKVLVTEPKLLLLDEPSTGLDVAARIELWEMLGQMRKAGGTTIAVTTHLMDEADRCDRLAIIDKGRLLDTGSPDTLKSRVGGDVITFSGPYLEQLKALVEEKTGTSVRQVEGGLRMERENAHRFVPELIELVPGMIESVSVGRPTLDDVFVHITGRRLVRADDATREPLHPRASA